MKSAFAFLALTAALTGCAHTQPPADASLEDKPRIPINQPQSAALVAPAPTVPTPSGA